MNTPTAAVGRFHRRNLDYFARFREQAARANLRQLRAASAAFGAFLLGYGTITHFMFRSGALTACYLIFGGVDLAFLLCAFLGMRREPSPRTVWWACMLLILAVMGFAVAVSVFPFPDKPGIFFPLAYMLVLVVFILPYRHIAALLSLVTAAYLLLTAGFKTAEAMSYDVFAAVTTWALGFFILYVVTDLRLRDGERLVELERISRTDPLTGLPNRRHMEESMALAYRRCQHAGVWAAVLMLDVDDFKAYNDRLGHPAGDECLRALGGIFQTFAAEQGIFAARYGGEEFLFFLPECDEESAQWAAAELLARVRALELPFPGHGSLTVSMGLAAELPSPAGSWTTLVQRADQALYRSKAEGKDRMELWEEAR